MRDLTKHILSAWGFEARGRLLWSLLLGLVGMGVHQFAPIEIFGGATFQLGAIFSLVSAIVLGPAAGALAAALAVVPMFLEGNLGYALLLIAEATAVGWGVQRRLAPLTADLLFWAAGAPLLLAWMALSGGGWSFEAWLPAIHAPINGAVCVVVADLLLLLWTLRVPGPRRLASEHRMPLRRHLVPWLALVTLIPILGAGLFTGRERAREAAAEQEQKLRLGSEGVARTLENVLTEQLRAVASAAQDLALSPTSDPERLGARLEAVRLTYETLSTLLVTDAGGRALAGAPREKDGVLWWNDSVAHRDYFTVPMRTSEPYVSDVFLGAGFAENAIVGLSAPILGVADGAPAGVVEASVDARKLQLLALPFADPELELVVIDRDQRVLFGLGREFYEPLVELPEPELLRAMGGGEAGRLRWTPSRDSASAQLSTALWRPVPSAGWKVIGIMPALRADQAAAMVYVRYALGMLVAVVLTSLFASAIAMRVTKPLERLVQALRRVEADSMPAAMPETGSTAPREVAELIDDFSAMAGRLKGSYAQLRQSLEEREALNLELEGLLSDLDGRVQERTRELTLSRRKAVDLQRQFRGLLDDIEAVICEFDLESGRFTFVSRRIGEIIGYLPEVWYQGHISWPQALPKEARLSVLRKIRRAVKSESSYALEHPILTASGERKWLRHVGRILEGPDGGRVLRCLMLDITASRQAQQDQLRQRQLESVGTLAGGIAHDFNNLLTTVLGNLSLARLEVEEGGETADILEALDQIDAAGADAQRLTYQLMTFARGGQPIRRRCRFEDIVEDLEASADPRVSREVVLAHDLPDISADRRQIAQVLAELVRNAEQSTPTGGTVRVEAEYEDFRRQPGPARPPGDSLRVRVADTGIGMSEEVLEKVFDPYFTTREEGRGFGLATAYSIITNHEGHIVIESAVGEGTTVTFWLPAIGLEDEVSREITLAAGRAKTGRLLLMDDEPSVRLVAGRMLERLGWEVTSTADGSQAIEQYRQAQEAGARFDAVLTDLSVPGGMGGAATMKELLRLDPKVRAVVCSGYSNDPVMASYREHGFVGVLTKPFSMVDLRDGLAEAMEKPL
ncbi:MAG: ATP-binding protein [Acidobacteriota bacterium]